MDGNARALYISCHRLAPRAKKEGVFCLLNYNINEQIALTPCETPARAKPKTRLRAGIAAVRHGLRVRDPHDQKRRRLRRGAGRRGRHGTRRKRRHRKRRGRNRGHPRRRRLGGFGRHRGRRCSQIAYGCARAERKARGAERRYETVNARRTIRVLSYHIVSNYSGSGVA